MSHRSIHRPSALAAAIALGALGAAFAQVSPAEAPAAPLPQETVVIQAPPQPVPQPPGLAGPLSREGVVAEFEAMRAANVLGPAGEVGDTEWTAERRNQYHRAQARAWEDYQDRLAAYQAAEIQRAYEAALLRAEQQAREAEAAADTGATPPVEPGK
jgi:hypothetical protein